MNDTQVSPSDSSALLAKNRVIGAETIWDMTLPGMFSGLNDAGTLKRFHDLGYRFVSVTAANDTCHDPDIAEAFIRTVQGIAAEDPARFRVARSSADVSKALENKQLAISFNFQGTNPFAGDVRNVERFAKLALDHALLAYNEPNRVGDGCASFPGEGLSPFGRELIRAMNGSGVIVDGSHAGYRTTMEAMELGTAPFIFSHSNAHGVFPHYRNLRDDQITACAASGGVIGVNGVGAFLNEHGRASAQQIFSHVDYLVSLVGDQHVGLALDFIERTDVFAERVAKETEKWPLNDGKQVCFEEFAAPEIVRDVAAHMANHGYGAAQIENVFWRNFHRVYSQVVG
ncbi:MAG: hypothetical protein GKS00_24830 [Alphaproteobacteria bacterium]|nr:hypothetical protein [Alphaproteobacteria bacterium]